MREHDSSRVLQMGAVGQQSDKSIHVQIKNTDATFSFSYWKFSRAGGRVVMPGEES